MNLPLKSSVSRRHSIRSSLLALGVALGILNSSFASEITPPRRISTATSAYDIWAEMTRSSLTFEPIELQISPKAGAVSFGAEKEGGDASITGVMSPTSTDLKIIVGTLRADKRKLFLTDFLNGLAQKKYDIRSPIVSAAGEKISSPISPALKDYAALDLESLEREFDRWNAETHDRPFAFLQKKIRVQIYDGDFAGMSEIGWIDRAMKEYPRVFDKSRSSDPVPVHFNNWKPIYGMPEKVISKMVTEIIGIWEVNIKPQTTYGDYEKAQVWFRNALKDREGPYGAFGHQWLVLPKYEVSDSQMQKIMEERLGELYKLGQALITLRGIKYNSGILTSMYNEVRSDEQLRTHNLERSVLRLKNELFPSNTGAPALNIEQRSGTALNPTRRLIQQSIASRYVAHDWEGLVKSQKYTLIDHDPLKMIENLGTRFGVTEFEVKRCLERIKSVRFEGDEEMVQGLRPASLAPFWYWENAPFLSDLKKAQVRKVTRNFIQQVAALSTSNDPQTLTELSEEFARWVTITDLDTDIEFTLKPNMPHIAKQNLGYFKSPISHPKFDVNQIRKGTEYTTRFLLRPSSEFTEAELAHGKKGFLELNYDMTPDEKREVIRQVAAILGKKLNGHKVEPLRVDAAGHGHSIAITYNVATPSGDTWRVEWDGIGRAYDEDGKVIPGSERGGVVEIVTPRGIETEKEAVAFFETLEEVGGHASYYAGGGHISVDFSAESPFNGKPREIARFIALFLENRDVMTAMFQYPGRFPTAEPTLVNASLFDQLKDFRGSMAELQTLLYESRVFNDRLGRKTKYSQLDVSPIFQNVIPAEHLTEDFDVKKAVYRRSFRLSPNIVKAEFRLFGAPRSVEESHAQKQFVNALLDKALNDTTPIRGRLAEIDLEKMVANAPDSFRRFEETMAELGLDRTQFAGLYGDGLQSVSNYISHPFYEPYEKKMKSFPHLSGWLPAVKARSLEEGINSKGRVWDPSLAEGDAVKLKATYDEANRQTLKSRKDGKIPEKDGTLSQDWREYDQTTVARAKKLSWKNLVHYPEIALDYLYEKYVETGKQASTAPYLKTLRSSVNAYDRMVEELLRHRGAETTFERARFYLMTMESGEVAAEAASHFLARGSNEQLAVFSAELRLKPFVSFQIPFVTSLPLRRALYGRLGNRFETAWGDLVETVISDSGKRSTSRRFELITRLRHFIHENEVFLGEREAKLLTEFDSEVARNDRSGSPKQESMASLIRRRCPKLLAPEAHP